MLDTIALGILCFSALVVFYGIIVIHDIPYEIAKHRNHPHSDAIHVAGWVSLLTLHILWPFLWIWSTLYREDRGWGFSNEKAEDSPLLLIETQLAELSTRIKAIEDSNSKSILENQLVTVSKRLKAIEESAVHVEKQSKSESSADTNDTELESK